jgi:hypothetical protein
VEEKFKEPSETVSLSEEVLFTAINLEVCMGIDGCHAGN